MIQEIADLEERGVALHQYFEDTLVEDLNAYYGLVVHFAGQRKVADFHLMGEDDLILHLFAKRSHDEYHVSAGGELSLEPPTGAVTHSSLGGKIVSHKGLPILVIDLEHLPPSAVMIILEVRNRRTVSGVVYKGSKRDTEPKASGGLRSWHQNELGLLPRMKEAPESWSLARGKAYHDFWEEEREGGIAGRQRDKQQKIVETGVYELTVGGVTDKVRLMYDYVHDRFFFTFHYKIIQLPDASTKHPKTKQLSEAVAELKSPSKGERWTSGYFLVDIPPDSPCVIAPPDEEDEEEEETVTAAPPPFPGMPLTPSLPGHGVTLQVPRKLWEQAVAAFNRAQQALEPQGLKLEAGTASNDLIVYNYVTKEFFDFHLTCLCDTSGQNIMKIHLAVRLTGAHTSVIYWWYALSCGELPDGIKKIQEKLNKNQQPAKGGVIPLDDYEWHLDGSPNGHGAADLPGFWKRIEPYEALLNGEAILDGILRELRDKAKGVKVVTSQRPEDKGKAFFCLCDE
ncbi:hypothetical protein AB0B45_43945 [Nonomuraea sp. NPDC049152]|uniref:hypothetical protein n=1 Tax=Nonomuraea sp. NPDC049152 TaxID=3154350 RepID=UPI0033C3D953